MKNPKTVIAKKTPNGRTLAHLSKTDEKNDTYSYYPPYTKLDIWLPRIMFPLIILAAALEIYKNIH